RGSSRTAGAHPARVPATGSGRRPILRAHVGATERSRGIRCGGPAMSSVPCGLAVEWAASDTILTRVPTNRFQMQRGDTAMSDYNDRPDYEAMRREHEEAPRPPRPGDYPQPQDFVAPLGSSTSGRLVFAQGISRVNLRSEAMDDLFRAHFEGVIPNVRVQGN